MNDLLNKTPILPTEFEILRKYNIAVLFDPNAPCWIKVTPSGALVLDKCDGNKKVKDIIEEINSELGKNATEELLGFFDYVYTNRFLLDGRTDSNIQDSKLKSIHINLTKRCNLNCIYCYANVDTIEIDELTTEIWTEFLIELSKNYNDITLVFSGGEPTLYPGILELASTAKSKGFKIELLSNGLEIDNILVGNSVELFDLIQINLDSIYINTHEYLRGFGTFEPTIKNIKALISKGANLRIGTVVSNKNKNEVKAIKNFVENGLRLTIKFQPIYKMGKGKKAPLYLSPTDYYKAMHKASNYPPIFEEASSRIFSRTISCGVGTNTLSIDPNGDVYPCHLLHEVNLKIGNIREESILRIHEKAVGQFREYTVDNLEDCKRCNIRYICGGMCRARAYHYRSSFFKKDPFCSYIKKTIINTFFV